MAGDPIVAILNQISATAVSVAWIQPSEGATVTGYVVHYSDGITDRTESVAASSTSTDILNLSSGQTYTISVEATSSQLSGESEAVTIAVGECILWKCARCSYNMMIFLVSQCSQYIYISYRNSTSSSRWCDCEW